MPETIPVPLPPPGTVVAQLPLVETLAAFPTVPELRCAALTPKASRDTARAINSFFQVSVIGGFALPEMGEIDWIGSIEVYRPWESHDSPVPRNTPPAAGETEGGDPPLAEKERARLTVRG